MLRNPLPPTYLKVRHTYCGIPYARNSVAVLDAGRTATLHVRMFSMSPCDQAVAVLPNAFSARSIPGAASAKSCTFIAGRTVSLALNARNQGSAIAGNSEASFHIEEYVSSSFAIIFGEICSFGFEVNRIHAPQGNKFESIRRSFFLTDDDTLTFEIRDKTEV